MPSPRKPKSLRERAEERARESKTPLPATPEARETLIHELQVHQIELEMQQDELRRAQRESELLQTKYMDLYDLAPVGYFTLDEKHGILEVNLTGARFVGVDRGRLLKQPFTHFIFSEDQDHFYLLFKETLHTSSPQTGKLRMTRPDGTMFHAQMEAAVSFQDGSRAVRVVVIDITERWRAEERLLESHETLNAIFEASQEATFLMDRKGIVINANTETARRLGIRAAELCGRCIFDFLPQELAASRRAKCEQVFKSGLPDCFEDERGERIIMNHLRPVFDSEGKVSRIAVFGMDVTDRRRAESALELWNETLESSIQERTATLLAANQELERRAEQLRKLAGELTMAEHRERKNLSQVLHDGLQQYLVAAKLRLGGLVAELPESSAQKSLIELEDLLGEVSKIARSLAAELSPPVLHQGGLVEGLEWLSRWMSKKHKLEIELTSKGAAAQMPQDVKIFVFESVRELLLNVVKHAKATYARIHLWHEEGQALRIKISDNGCGFDPMAVLSQDSNPGFGLLSVRERVGLIGGALEIDSSPGKGATFTITSPLR